MEKKTNPKKKPKKETNSAESEWSNDKLKSYISFLYNQNERLWKEIEAISKELNELSAKARGEY